MNYRTVYQGGIGELYEKKSRFIGEAVPVENELKAQEVLLETKKKYRDASHTCSAYIIGPKQELQHTSDDGEPSGTAGRPILDVLSGEKLCNVIITVTRYFGGTLLGTGGLTRAYTNAAKEALAQSILIEKTAALKFNVRADYSHLGRLQYIAAEAGIHTCGIDYADQVILHLIAEPDKAAALTARFIEATSASAQIEESGSCYFARIGKEILLFDH